MPYKRFDPNGPSVIEAVSACPDCDGENIDTKLIDHRFPYGDGTSAAELSARVPLRRCRDCGTEYLDSEAESLMHEAVCNHHGVMTPAEVRAIRQQCGGLSRADFARVTRLGEATLGRWERGELIQNAANDQLLYLLTFPENLIRLRERLKRVSHEGIAASSATSQPRFRVLNVTAELTEQAESFVLATAGAA